MRFCNSERNAVAVCGCANGDLAVLDRTGVPCKILYHEDAVLGLSLILLFSCNHQA